MPALNDVLQFVESPNHILPHCSVRFEEGSFGTLVQHFISFLSAIPFHLFLFSVDDGICFQVFRYTEINSDSIKTLQNDITRFMLLAGLALRIGIINKHIVLITYILLAASNVLSMYVSTMWVVSFHFPVTSFASRPYRALHSRSSSEAPTPTTKTPTRRFVQHPRHCRRLSLVLYCSRTAMAKRLLCLRLRTKTRRRRAALQDTTTAAVRVFIPH